MVALLESRLLPSDSSFSQNILTSYWQGRPYATETAALGPA